MQYTEHSLTTQQVTQSFFRKIQILDRVIISLLVIKLLHFVRHDKLCGSIC